MPSGDYAIAGGGALKIKGAKIQKKKKKNKDRNGLEKSLSAAGDEARLESENSLAAEKDARQGDGEDDDDVLVPKTESERRHEEVKRKRLQKLAESSGSRPELLRTHKERVEELNTYLSKLSEHHDMPKIGPG